MKSKFNKNPQNGFPKTKTCKTHIILDDGMQPKYFNVDSAFGTSMPKKLEADNVHYFMKDVFALCTDLTNEAT